ncbi:MAG: hypothetical protein Q9159_007392 [Coniocarpon cinnabarinum]
MFTPSQLLLSATALAAVSTATPLKPRQELPNSCGVLSTPFTLSAQLQNGTQYPLFVTFPAEETSETNVLRVTANPGAGAAVTPTQFTERHLEQDGTDYNTGFFFLTNHKAQTNPNGDPVPYGSGTPPQGNKLTLEQGTGLGQGLGKTCGDLEGNPTYYVLEQDIYGWQLCDDGDVVDETIGFQVVYSGATAPAGLKCVPMALRQFAQ